MDSQVIPNGNLNTELGEGFMIGGYPVDNNGDNIYDAFVGTIGEVFVYDYYIDNVDDIKAKNYNNIPEYSYHASEYTFNGSSGIDLSSDYDLVAAGLMGNASRMAIATVKIPFVSTSDPNYKAYQYVFTYGGWGPRGHDFGIRIDTAVESPYGRIGLALWGDEPWSDILRLESNVETTIGASYDGTTGRVYFFLKNPTTGSWAMEEANYPADWVFTGAGATVNTHVGDVIKGILLGAGAADDGTHYSPLISGSTIRDFAIYDYAITKLDEIPDISRKEPVSITQTTVFNYTGKGNDLNEGELNAVVEEKPACLLPEDSPIIPSSMNIGQRNGNNIHQYAVDTDGNIILTEIVCPEQSRNVGTTRFIKVTNTGTLVLDPGTGKHNGGGGRFTYSTAQELIDAYNSATTTGGTYTFVKGPDFDTIIDNLPDTMFDNSPTKLLSYARWEQKEHTFSMSEASLFIKIPQMTINDVRTISFWRTFGKNHPVSYADNYRQYNMICWATVAKTHLLDSIFNDNYSSEYQFVLEPAKKNGGANRWFNRDGGYHPDYPNNTNLHLQYQNDNNQFKSYNNTTYTVTGAINRGVSDGDLSAGDLYHFVITYDGPEMEYRVRINKYEEGKSIPRNMQLGTVEKTFIDFVNVRNLSVEDSQAYMTTNFDNISPQFLVNGGAASNSSLNKDTSYGPPSDGTTIWGTASSPTSDPNKGEFKFISDINGLCEIRYGAAWADWSNAAVKISLNGTVIFMDTTVGSEIKEFAVDKGDIISVYEEYAVMNLYTIKLKEYINETADTAEHGGNPSDVFVITGDTRSEGWVYSDMIHDVRIYEKKLSVDEINSIYTAGPLDSKSELVGMHTIKLSLNDGINPKVYQDFNLNITNSHNLLCQHINTLGDTGGNVNNNIIWYDNSNANIIGQNIVQDTNDPVHASQMNLQTPSYLHGSDSTVSVFEFRCYCDFFSIGLANKPTKSWGNKTIDNWLKAIWMQNYNSVKIFGFNTLDSSSMEVMHDGTWTNYGNSLGDFSNQHMKIVVTPSTIKFYRSGETTAIIGAGGLNGTGGAQGTVSTSYGWPTQTAAQQKAEREEIFNNSVTQEDRWGTHNGYGGADYGENEWIKFDVGNIRKNITMYRLWARGGTSASDGIERAQFLPRDWRIEGSNDDINWTILDIRTGIKNDDIGHTNNGGNLNDIPYNEYRIQNPGAYRYYRLWVVSSNNKIGLMISELAYYESPWIEIDEVPNTTGVEALYPWVHMSSSGRLSVTKQSYDTNGKMIGQYNLRDSSGDWPVTTSNTGGMSIPNEGGLVLCDPSYDTTMAFPRKNSPFNFDSNWTYSCWYKIPEKRADKVGYSSSNCYFLFNTYMQSTISYIILRFSHSPDSDGGDDDFRLQFRDSEQNMENWNDFKPSMNISDGHWHHISLAWDYENKRASVYIDFELQDISNTVSRQNGGSNSVFKTGYTMGLAKTGSYNEASEHLFPTGIYCIGCTTVDGFASRKDHCGAFDIWCHQFFGSLLTVEELRSETITPPFDHMKNLVLLAATNSDDRINKPPVVAGSELTNTAYEYDNGITHIPNLIPNKLGYVIVPLVSGYSFDENNKMWVGSDVRGKDNHIRIENALEKNDTEFTLSFRFVKHTSTGNHKGLIYIAFNQAISNTGAAPGFGYWANNWQKVISHGFGYTNGIYNPVWLREKIDEKWYGTGGGSDDSAKAFAYDGNTGDAILFTMTAKLVDYTHPECTASVPEWWEVHRTGKYWLIRMYFDGNLEHQAFYRFGVDDPTIIFKQMNIGVGHLSDHHTTLGTFKKFYDLRVYNRQLSQESIKNLYDSGRMSIKDEPTVYAPLVNNPFNKGLYIRGNTADHLLNSDPLLFMPSHAAHRNGPHIGGIPVFRMDGPDAIPTNGITYWRGVMHAESTTGNVYSYYTHGQGRSVESRTNQYFRVKFRCWTSTVSSNNFLFGLSSYSLDAYSRTLGDAAAGSGPANQECFQIMSNSVDLHAGWQNAAGTFTWWPTGSINPGGVISPDHSQINSTVIELIADYPTARILVNGNEVFSETITHQGGWYVCGTLPTKATLYFDDALPIKFNSGENQWISVRDGFYSGWDDANNEKFWKRGIDGAAATAVTPAHVVVTGLGEYVNETDGRYFSFDRQEWLNAFGTNGWHGAHQDGAWYNVRRIRNNGESEPIHILSLMGTGGSNTNYDTGRKHPHGTNAAGDWQVGDIIVQDGFEMGPGRVCEIVINVETLPGWNTATNIVSMSHLHIAGLGENYPIAAGNISDTLRIFIGMEFNNNTYNRVGGPAWNLVVLPTTIANGEYHSGAGGAWKNWNVPLKLGETKHSFEITADGMGVIWYVNGIPHKENTHARGGSWSSTWDDGLKDPSRHHLNQNALRGVIRKSFMNHCIIGGRAMYGNLFVEDTCPGTEVSHFAVKTTVHNWLHAKFFNNDEYAFNYGSRGVKGADDSDFNNTSITNEQARFRINQGNIWVGPNCTYNADLCRWSLHNSNNGLVVIDNYLNASDTEFSISYLNYCNSRTSGVGWNGGVQFLSASSAFNNNGMRIQMHMRGNNGYMNMITPLYLESIEGNYATNGYSANYLFGYSGANGNPWIGTHQGNNTYAGNSTWNTNQIPVRNGEEHLVFTFKVESDGYVRIQVYRKDELRFYARFLPSVNSSTGKRYTLKDMVGKCLIGKSHYSSGHGASYNTDGSQIYDIRVINKALNLSEIKSMYPRIFDIYAHISHSNNSDGLSCRSIAQTGAQNHFMKYGGIVGGATAVGTSQWNTYSYSFGSNTKILKDEIEFFIPNSYTTLSIGIDSEPHKNWGSSQGMDQRIKDATKDIYGFHASGEPALFIYGSRQDNGSGTINGYGEKYTVAWANPQTLQFTQRHLKIKMNKRISKIEFARLDGFRVPYTKLPKDFGTIFDNSQAHIGAGGLSGESPTTSGGAHGIATASSFIGTDRQARHAFNNSVTREDRWQTGPQNGGADYGENEWIKFDVGNNRKNIGFYRIWARGGTDSSVALANAQQLPRDWRIEGSNDDINWTILDVRTGINNDDIAHTNSGGGISSEPFNEYRMQNPGTYRYYRLWVVSTNSIHGINISELAYYVVPEDVNYLGYDSSDGNFIVATDGTNSYWKKHSFGTDNLGKLGETASTVWTDISYWAFDETDGTIIVAAFHNTYYSYIKITLDGTFVTDSGKYEYTAASGQNNGVAPSTYNSQSQLVSDYNDATDVVNSPRYFQKGANFPNDLSKMCKIDLDGSYIDNSCRLGDIVDITNESELKDVYDNATNASNDFTFETGVNYSFLPENSEEAKIEMYVDNHLMKTFTPKNKTGIWYLGGLINRRKDNDGPAVYISSPELPTYGKIGEFS